jgi:hypothetical protein
MNLKGQYSKIKKKQEVKRNEERKKKEETYIIYFISFFFLPLTDKIVLKKTPKKKYVSCHDYRQLKCAGRRERTIE